MPDRLPTLVLGDVKDDINRWLIEHPIVPGLIFIGLGILLVRAGVGNIRTGVTTSKLGKEYRGGIAKTAGYVRIVTGIGLAIFGLYITVMW